MKIKALLIYIIICFNIINAIDPSTPFGSYLQTKKYLYVWTYPNSDNFLKFVKDHNFSRVYIYVGCIEWDYDNLSKGNFFNSGNSDAKELIQNLISQNIEVEPTIYLNDSPNDFTNVEKVEEVAKAMGQLQKTLKFKALHFDVEPSNAVNFQSLLKMYENARKYVPVSAILKPGWLNKNMVDVKSKFDEEYFEKFKNCETFVDAIMTVTDYSDLMAYSNTYSIIENFLSKYDVIRKRHPGHDAKPVIELDPNITNDGIAAEFKKDNKKFFEFLEKVSKQFDGITIHNYMAWNIDLYCNKPTRDSVYYFGEPKQC